MPAYPCERCGHPNSRVFNTRAHEGLAPIRRRRRCESCGHAWTTYEISEAQAQQLERIVEIRRSTVRDLRQAARELSREAV